MASTNCWGREDLAKGVGDVRAQETDLVQAARPEEVDRVGHDVRDPRGGDALALADQAVGEKPPEAPHDAARHEAVGAQLPDEGEAVDRELLSAKLCPEAGGGPHAGPPSPG
eukprot:8146418-Alexandrium_andersonii.AAC.1